MKYNKGWENITEYNKTMTTEEARTRGATGGRNSGKARQERKTMKEDALFILNLLMSQEKEDFTLEEVQAIAELNNRNITVQQACILQQVQKALSGDLKALEFLQGLTGEQPTQKIEISEAEKLRSAYEDINNYLFKDDSEKEMYKYFAQKEKGEI